MTKTLSKEELEYIVDESKLMQQIEVILFDYAVTNIHQRDVFYSAERTMKICKEFYKEEAKKEGAEEMLELIAKEEGWEESEKHYRDLFFKES